MTEGKKARDDEAEDRAEARAEDVALVVGSSPDGAELGVLRKRGETVEAAIMRRAREGQPLHGDLVRLVPRQESLLFDVETLHEVRPVHEAAHEPKPAPPPHKAGPAQVASDDYRKGWDRLFKKKKSAVN